MSGFELAVGLAKQEQWYLDYLARCKEYHWNGPAKPPVIEIRLNEWEQVPGEPKGTVRRKCGRLIEDIAADIALAAKQRELDAEWVSSGGIRSSERWPRGEGVLALENGANEGYKLTLYCHARVLEGNSMKGSPVICTTPILTAKLLLSKDAAFQLYRIIWDLLDE